jgi:hypothetical protein
MRNEPWDGFLSQSWAKLLESAGNFTYVQSDQILPISMNLPDQTGYNAGAYNPLHTAPSVQFYTEHRTWNMLVLTHSIKSGMCKDKTATRALSTKKSPKIFIPTSLPRCSSITFPDYRSVSLKHITDSLLHSVFDYFLEIPTIISSINTQDYQHSFAFWKQALLDLSWWFFLILVSFFTFE